MEHKGIFIMIAIAVAVSPFCGLTAAHAEKNGTGVRVIEDCDNGTLTAESSSGGIAIAKYASRTGELVDIATDGRRAAIYYDGASGYKTKIMHWDSMENMRPLETACHYGSSTVFTEDFEGDVYSVSVHSNGNYISGYNENNGNRAMRMKRTDGGTNTGGDFFIAAANILLPYSDYGVYEFDITVLDAATRLNIYTNDSTNAHRDYIAQLKTTAASLMVGGIELNRYSAEKQISADSTYHISAVYNYHDHTKSIYVNGEQLTFDEPIILKDGETASYLRFHTASGTSDCDVLIDNIRVYEGAVPKTIINLPEKIVNYSEAMTVFESEEAEKELLNGYCAVHSRSGVAYCDGVKTLLKNKPYMKNDETYVAAKELCDAWGEELPKSVVTDDGGYVALSVLAQALGKTLYSDSAAKNNGMNILGDSKFAAPSDVQKLNDYLFYLRPTVQQLRAAYLESQSRGQHPRIQATAADFARVRAEYESGRNGFFMSWAGDVIRRADYIASGRTPHISYVISGGSLLGQCRNLLDEMYVLGMAYQLTGEMKYVEHAWLELESVSTFADWHPSHHLDPCEMGFAVAIGYDWMYNAFSPEQRAVIEKGMYNNLFYDAALSYKTSTSAMTNSATATNNHNIVCNGGIAIAAMSMLDVYPNESYYLLKNALRAADLMLWHWAPDGSWYEGAGYWELTMQYTAGLLSTLDTVMETNFGLDTCDGLDTAADFMIYMQTQNGVYNTGDCSQVKLYVPEMLWLSDKYGKPYITSAILKYNGANLTYNNAYHGDNVLGMLWYDTENTSADITMPLDVCYSGDNMVSMRNNWMQDDSSVFVGIHGGETNVDHSQLDGGSFIFEKDGIRWAKDPGMGNYNSIGYWITNYSEGSSNRWSYFRSKALSHNTVVIGGDQATPEHDLNSTAQIISFRDDDGSAAAVVDMSGLLRDNASAAKRGFLFTDNRESLVIRDELTLNSSKDVYWYMMTDADVALDSTGATLTQNGKVLRLDFAAEGGAATITKTDAEALRRSLISSGIIRDDGISETGTRIAIKLSGSGKATLTVKLSDGTGRGPSSYGAIADWMLDNDAMSKWKNAATNRSVARIDYMDLKNKN